MKHQQRCSHRVMAFEREWPNPEFIEEVEESFPEQGIANVEEARVRHKSSDSAAVTLGHSHHEYNYKHETTVL